MKKRIITVFTTAALISLFAPAAAYASDVTLPDEEADITLSDEASGDAADNVSYGLSEEEGVDVPAEETDDAGLMPDTDKGGSAPAFAENNVVVNYPDGMPEIPFSNGDQKVNKSVNLPRQYSSLGKLPAVRHQLTTGTCWAHATIGSIEADLIHDKKETKDIDLSEMHLAYYMYQKYEDPRKCRTDYATLNGKDYLQMGGDAVLASTLMAKLVGAVKDSDVPLREDPKGFAPSDSSYVVSKDVAQVRDAFFVSVKDSSAIKTAIMEHGAVTADIGYYDKYYDANNRSYYNNTTGTNHTIMFAGWDDDFSRENFISTSGVKPSGNGAWLVRNSWGDGWGDGGYFWLSYYDASFYNSDKIGNKACVAFNASTDVYDNCYAYDGGLTETSCTVGKDDTVCVDYDVAAHEAVKGVSVQLRSADVTVQITAVNKKTGDSVVKRRKTSHAGTYTIEFDRPLEVYEASVVEVTMKLVSDDGKDVALSVEYPKEFEIFGSNIVVVHPTVDRGFYVDGHQIGADPRIRLYTDKSNATYVKVTGVSLPQSLSVYKGAAATLKATVMPANATFKTVTWSSSDTSVASVSANGVVTGKKTGTAVITVKTREGGKTATCRVTVKPVKVKKIKLNTTKKTVKTGKTYKLSATVSPDNATDKSLKWKSSNTKIAKVTQKGKVTAVKSGKATITVTAKDGSNKKATCKITVKDIKVNKVKLDKTKASVKKGKTIKLKATVKPADATNKNVTWKSSDKDIATVTQKGKVRGIHRGTAKITVTTKDGKKKATCTVTVK